MTRTNPRTPRGTAATITLFGLFLVGACHGRRGDDAGHGALELTGVRHGRLVDVFASRSGAEGVELHERDVLIAYDISAVIAAGECAWFGVDPDSLNPRVAIPQRREHPEFTRILDALRQGTVSIESGAGAPVVVPRDAAFELQFDGDVPDLDFFAEIDREGRVVASRNREAVQLARREAVGDTPVPIRIVPRGKRLLLDPVLGTDEARAWGLPENGAGLPESAASDVANLEVRLPIGTAASLPGLRGGRTWSNGTEVAVPLRSGNARDHGGHLNGGYAVGSVAPRVLGALTMYLEAVVDVNASTQQVTLFKNSIAHDIDDGDVIRLFIDNSGVPVVVTDIIADPLDDRGQPSVGHVRALVTRTPGLRENDPRRLPNYPANPGSAEGERWLVANAPRAVLMAEFIAERRAPSGQIYGDDPRYFVQWSPAPLPDVVLAGDRVEPGDNVSPFAGAVVRFTRPVNPATVRAIDSFFFATRDLLGEASVADFVRRRNIDPGSFDADKHRTPHLVAATAVPADGTNTTFRLQPPLGFYLDSTMRQADQDVAFADKRYKYWLHLFAGRNGIADGAGNRLDLQWTVSAKDHVALPFALDLRRGPSGTPLFADNHVVSVCRRFASRDEDEQPSYYIDDEVRRPNSPPNPNAYPLPDVAGAVLLGNGRVEARPTTRVTRIADDLNQEPPPPQTSSLRWCPLAVSGEAQIASTTGGVRFGLPIQNPTNPEGCRLQTLWREIDLTLSRVDPFDFNLDVEAMYWGVHATSAFVLDEFERTSLYLGHSEVRPEPCVGSTSALPSLSPSGAGNVFADNYAFNRDRAGNKEDSPPPHEAFADQRWVLDPSRLVREPNNVNRFSPMPGFTRPYFVWRDELLPTQGGSARTGSDVLNNLRDFEPYIISPSLQGQGRYVTSSGGSLMFHPGMWSNAQNFEIGTNRFDNLTGGCLGALALPLLVDCWVDPHDPAFGTRPPIGSNGWQIALTVQSSAMPAFRAYSAGGVVAGQRQIVNRSSPGWQTAVGGISATGQRTPALDNSLYWSMFDFAKTRTVMTAGFVEILDPHRIPDATIDVRLGPYFARAFPAGKKVVYAPLFDPPLASLPPGTSIEAEYRGAGALDPQPWRALADRYATLPDARNFPLDPMKAGDAHIRKNDTRLVGTQPRNWWTYFYNRNITAYTAAPDQLSDPTFVRRFAGPLDTFGPEEIRYVNWRLVMRNSAGNPSVAPALDSFMLAYRFEAR